MRPALASRTSSAGRRCNSKTCGATASTVYDKIMIVVDRLQLRSQIDSKMLNMNIDKKMFVEAHNKTTFLEALKSDTRIVIVNLQKFGSVRQMLTADVLEKLAQLRIAFLIDEIHRSHGGDQHEEMVTIFDELQTPFDNERRVQPQTRQEKRAHRLYRNARRPHAGAFWRVQRLRGGRKTLGALRRLHHAGGHRGRLHPQPARQHRARRRQAALRPARQPAQGLHGERLQGHRQAADLRERRTHRRYRRVCRRSAGQGCLPPDSRRR